jgi:hypothetical protein
MVFPQLNNRLGFINPGLTLYHITHIGWGPRWIAIKVGL